MVRHLDKTRLTDPLAPSLKPRYSTVVENLGNRDRIDALLFALIAGWVDAAGFLQLGGFFVSFMSGNSTRLGVGLGSGYWREAGLAAGLIALFVGGVALGSLLRLRLGERRGVVLILVEAIFLGIAGGFHQAGLPGGATVPMVIAMGIANATFERGSDARFGVTYLTGALVRAGQGIAEAVNHGSPSNWKLYATPWLAMIVGATIGAQTYPLVGGQILWGPALMLLMMAIVPRRSRPVPSPWAQAPK